jgi:hypothetical protein
MPRKTFIDGDTLPASDLNLLMNQSVMTFATSAARTTAIPTPTEGMVSYLEDSNSYQFYNGAWIGLVPQSPNSIINGAFEINQRQFTSSTSTATYNFDRWRQDFSGGTFTTSSQAFTPGAAPLAGYEGSNFLRAVTLSQSAAGDFGVIQQRIERVRSFAGQTLTISFFAKAASGTPKIGIAMSQSFGTGGSPSAEINAPVAAVTISTSWARYSLTYAVPSISGKTLGSNNNDYLGLEFWVSAGSTLATRASSIGIQNNTFDIWGVQVEAGSAATPFLRNANSIQGELAACQRYYFRRTAETSFGILTNAHPAGSSSLGRALLPLPVTMRVTPTSIDFSGNLRSDDGYSSSATVSTITLNTASSSTNSVTLDATTAATLTTGRIYFLQATANTSFVGVSSEL